LNFFR